MVNGLKNNSGDLGNFTALLCWEVPILARQAGFPSYRNGSLSTDSVWAIESFRMNSLPEHITTDKADNQITSSIRSDEAPANTRLTAQNPGRLWLLWRRGTSTI
jgi:hypothetical protein